jgi:hypothetical protein
MRTFAFAVLFVLGATFAHAGVVTTGTWSALPALDHDGAPFFDLTSDDYHEGAFGYQLPGGGWEYLHNGAGGAVGFGFDGWTDGETGAASMVKVFGITAYTLGYLAYEAGAFQYIVPETGRAVSSWQGTFMALARKVTPEWTFYRLGAEDRDESQIDDYSDGVYEAAFRNPDYQPPCVGCTPTQTDAPPSVPEPAFLALFGIGAWAVGARARRRT